MFCREIMKPDVRYVTPQTTVAQVAVLMRDEQIGFIPICDEARKVIGIVTDRDIVVRVVAESESPNDPIARFMTPDVIACRSTDDLSVAQDLMGEMQVSRMLCLDEAGQLEGVISLSDIAQTADGLRAVATLRSVTLREARA